MKGNWYIVYTKEGWEIEVYQLLTRRKIEAFLPLTGKNQVFGNLKKIQGQPLFKSYVFVKTNEASLQKIKSISGIINVLYWLDSPVQVPQDEMDAVFNFVQHYPIAKSEKIPVNIESRSSLISTESNNNDRVENSNHLLKLYLPVIGQCIIAEAVTGKVRSINSDKKRSVLKNKLSVEKASSLIISE